MTILKINYYEPKLRIYVNIKERKTDAYYDIITKEWKPKKIGKDEEILKNIFSFAGVSSMEEFCKINYNIYTSHNEDDRILAEFHKVKNYTMNNKYYSLIQDLVKKIKDKNLIDTELLDSKINFINTNRIKYLQDNFIKQLNYMRYSNRDDKKMELEAIVNELEGLGQDNVSELKIQINQEFCDVSIYYYKSKLKQYIPIIKKCSYINKEYIDICQLYIKNLKTFNFNANELEGYLNETINSKIKEIEGILEEKLDYIKKFIIPISLYNKDQDDIKFKLIRDTENMSEDIYAKVKQYIKDLDIGEYDGVYSIIVSVDRLNKYDIKYHIVDTEIKIIKSFTELDDIPDVLEELHGKYFSANKGKKAYVATCDENGRIINFITEITGSSSTGKTLTYKFDKNYEFSDGYYAVRYGSWNHICKEVFKLEKNTWYKVDYSYERVIKN